MLHDRKFVHFMGLLNRHYPNRLIIENGKIEPKLQSTFITEKQVEPLGNLRSILID